MAPSMRPSLPTRKQTMYRRARDQSKLVLPPTMSLRNEIGALIANYSLSKDAWCIDELIHLLEQIDDDISSGPPANTALHHFANLGGLRNDRYTPEHPKAVVDAMRIAWPNTKADPVHIYLLGLAVQLSSTVIEYRNLYLWIRDGLFRIEKAISKNELQPEVFLTLPDNDDQVNFLTTIAVETNDVVQRMLGFAGAGVLTSEPARDALRFLSAIKKKLEEISRTDEAFAQMLKESAGDQALCFNYQDIRERYFGEADNDIAWLGFMDVTKFTQVAVRHKESHLARLLEQVIEHMEKAGIP